MTKRWDKNAARSGSKSERRDRAASRGSHGTHFESENGRNQEKQFNVELGNILRGKHPRWKDRIHTEGTQVLSESANLQPDILIDHPDGLPIIIETEFMPARSVEDDATSRLGTTLKRDGRKIEQVIALRAPKHLSTVNQGQLNTTIGSEQGLEFCMFSVSPNEHKRWPSDGWITGNVNDLADCIEFASMSENLITQGLDVLEDGVAHAANRVIKSASNHLPKIAEILHQEAGEQTTRMGMAIIANALTFHLAIRTSSSKIEPPKSLLKDDGLQQSRILDHWEFIYTKINYWPIFKIASDVLEVIPQKVANEVLGTLFEVASRLDNLGATSQHDLCGRMFQRLISDREFLATFYTLPSSAALLAELAVSRIKSDWSDPDSICNLHIGDFACGTGALLNAAYGAVANRHRRTGGNDGEIHAKMMEDVLYGTDIMPSATHLTATVLSSVHPGTPFGKTSIACLPYGMQTEGINEGQIAIGALDLIGQGSSRSLFDTGIKDMHGTHKEDDNVPYAFAPQFVLPASGFDLIIMNPPFTRPTGHESGKIGVPVPSFAGFATSKDEQLAMSEKLKKVTRPNMVGHGNAGLASNFIDVAHAKIKNGGVLALVLPFTFTQGDAWAAARKLIATHYRDIVFVSMASSEKTGRAFSADTGMAEVLVLATRRKGDTKVDDTPDPDPSILFANLYSRPKTLLEAVNVARIIQRIPPDKSEGMLNLNGKEQLGIFIRRPISETGSAGVRNPNAARTAVHLTQGRLSSPDLPEPISIPVTTLGNLGDRGLMCLDIIGTGQPPRGPFDTAKIGHGDVPTYPMLWSHDAKRETKLVVTPDKQGIVRQGCEDRAGDMKRRVSSRLHFTIDFQINSQSLTACMTPKPCIGGRAWPNFLCTENRWETPLVLWSNTTLGLISFWWLGTRQQQGRVSLSISRHPTLNVLDVREMTEAQFKRADSIFKDFKGKELLPAYEAWHDEVRQELDHAVLVDLLGLPETITEPLDLIRRQWCAEPSVHGGKKCKGNITLMES